MKVAVVQHRLREHVRMDLASLLQSVQDAGERGARFCACPCVPGIQGNEHIIGAFRENVDHCAPGVSVVFPCQATEETGAVRAFDTPVGRTVVLIGDDCIDADLYDPVARAAPDALVLQFDSESPLQAEALLEYALDCSLSLAGLILVASTVGAARGYEGHGGSAIVHMGEIVEEADDDQQVLVADVDVSSLRPLEASRLPSPSPILTQRLDVHRGRKSAVDWPADLS
jgi:hypothetical protein